MAEELPVHPLTGLTALGVLSSGRIVWPVLGAAPEDGDGDPGGEPGDGAPEGGEESGGGQGGQSSQGDDDLGDKGREALAKERKARRDAEKARKALEKELAELKAAGASAAEQDEARKAIEEARREAEQAAAARANERILSAEIRAAAAGKLADPSDAARYLDMTEFEVGDDGSVDAEAISEAISDLIKKKPYLAAKAQGFQGTGDGGARGNGRGRQLAAADLKTMSPQQIDQARLEGRLSRLLSGN